MWVEDSRLMAQGHEQGRRPMSTAQPQPLTKVRLIRAAFQPHPLRGALDQKVPDQFVGQISS